MTTTNDPNPKIGILITNIGTPAAPNKSEVRRYLKDFLSDRRIIELPKFIWWPILHGIILRFRPKQSAKLYAKIWHSKQGSPLLFNTQELAQGLQRKLAIPVLIGMHYSKPSIAAALIEFTKLGVDKILVLPLFPQYSATTTASTFDIIAKVLAKVRHLPTLRFINQYAANPHYIKAVAASISESWRVLGKSTYLLFSFHGIPKRYVEKGDPYAEQCHLTAKLIAAELNLDADSWSIAFQSRLGRTEWLKPYTDIVLGELTQRGIKEITAICPGFAVDCLETLEEIAIRGKEQFLEGGGEVFHYIPSLNATDGHVRMLEEIILPEIQGW
jgi:ferrochelatase